MNILGQRIGHWNRKTIQTGTCNVSWDDIISESYEVPQGIYICILLKNGTPAGVIKLVKE
jgi:hypothetical protein